MHLGRLTVAFLLLLAAIDIALLIRSLNDGSEQRAPAIGRASIQRVDNSKSGMQVNGTAPEEMQGAEGNSDSQPLTDSDAGPSTPKSDD